MATDLIIEDDLDFREHLAALIRARGHVVEIADHGADALLQLQVIEPPSLILLDLMMPEMDGWTFRAHMLRDPKLAAIPVAVLSGARRGHTRARKLQTASYL